MSCKPLNASCDDDELINSMMEFVDRFEADPASSMVAISKKDLALTKKALAKYKRDCKTCMSSAGGDYKCMQAAKNNLLRGIPMLGNAIYPWKNYDWNYANHVSNNYSPHYTGAKVSPTISQAYKNALAFIKIVNGIGFDANPNNKSVAGSTGRNSDYPYIPECSKNYRCKTTEKVKNSFKQRKPYQDPFLNMKTNGEYSSSYYFRVGSCPRHDLKTRKACESKGYTWSPNIFDMAVNKMKKKNGNDGQSAPGNCSQPRYAFIDNSPKTFFNGSNAKGFLPAIANDLMALTPDKLIGQFMGASISNSYYIQSCPETFQNYNSKNKNYYRSLIVVIILIAIIYYMI
jgi:hypothetical protein